MVEDLENIYSSSSANFQTNFNALGNREGRQTTRLNIVSCVTTAFLSKYLALFHFFIYYCLYGLAFAKDKMVLLT